MAVSLERFYPFAEPYLLGAPLPLLDQRIVSVAIDFCEQTHAVQTVVEPAQATRGDNEYDLEFEPDTTLASVLEVWWGTQRMTLVQPSAASEQPLHYPHVQARGTPRYATVDGETLKLYPRPDQRGDVTVKMAVKPRRDARTLPDVLFEDWAEVIGWGVVSQVATLPAQTFTNADLAMMASVHYRTAVSKATLQAAYGRVRGNLMVRQRPFI